MKPERSSAASHTIFVDNLPLSEFDLGGVLYHANYFHLYERVREDFLRSIDVPYPSLVQQGCHLAIVESHQNFHKPIRYGQRLTVRLTPTTLKRASVTFSYEILGADENSQELIHSAWTAHVFVSLASGAFKVSPLPSNLRNALSSMTEP